MASRLDVLFALLRLEPDLLRHFHHRSGVVLAGPLVASKPSRRQSGDWQGAFTPALLGIALRRAENTRLARLNRAEEPEEAPLVLSTRFGSRPPTRADACRSCMLAPMRMKPRC